MPITLENFRRFHLGMGVEHYFIYKFMCFNFEVHKIQPDNGLDLYITNISQQRFLSKPEFQCYLQVKAAIDVGNGNVSFSIHKDDLDLLRETKNSYLILARNIPSSEVDPDSYTINSTNKMLDQSVERFGNGYKITHLKEAREENSICADEIIDYDIDYIWLNNQHIERFLKDKKIYLNKDYYWFNFNTSKSYTDKLLDWNDIIPELKNIYFLINGCQSQSFIEQGYLNMSDYWG